MTVLFVVATVLLFLSIDWAVRRSRERNRKPGVAPSPVRDLSVRVPDGIFFSPSHTWLNLFPSGTVRLGVDDFIARLLARPVVRLRRSAGETVKKGEPILDLAAGGRSLTVRSPIDCDILSVNPSLEQRPGLLDEGLFSDGWAYTVRPARNGDLKSLFLGEETRRWMRTEFHRLKDLLAGHRTGGGLAAGSPAFLQEGGPPVAGLLDRMDTAVWDSLNDEFLKVQ